MAQCTKSRRARRAAAWLVALGVVSAGCASTPYRYGRFHPNEPGGVALEPIEVSYGRPRKTLDRIGWVLGAPKRILTLNRKTDNHRIDPETVEQLKTYLADNDITDVYVAVNEYDPKGQWKRLRNNRRIAPGWRYSVGALAWLHYTVLPNRLFGGDRYDPYANSLNLSSDVPALVLSEAAYAKDVHSRRFPGAYAAIVNDLPVLSVMRKSRAARDVLSYARAEGDWKTEEQAYKVLYPQIGASSVGTAGPFVPVFGPFLSWGGAAAGHATGRIVARVQRSKLTQPPPDDDASEAQTADANSPPPESIPPESGRAAIPASYSAERSPGGPFPADRSAAIGGSAEP